MNAVDRHIQHLEDLPISQNLRRAGEALVDALPKIRETTAGVLAGTALTLFGSESMRLQDSAHRQAMANRLDSLMQQADLPSNNYTAVAEAFNRNNPERPLDLTDPEMLQEQLVDTLTRTRTAKLLREAIQDAADQQFRDAATSAQFVLAARVEDQPKQSEKPDATTLLQPVAQSFGKESLDELKIREWKQIPAAINKVASEEAEKFPSKIEGKRYSDMGIDQLSNHVTQHLLDNPELIASVADKLEEKQTGKQQQQIATSQENTTMTTAEASTTLDAHNLNLATFQALIDSQQQRG